MKYNKEKIFWIARNASKDVVFIPWDEQKEEYYSFVKREVTSGYHQLSVTSEIMLKIILQFILLGNWSVDKIEMMEEDYELVVVLDSLIEKSRLHPENVMGLLEYIRGIVEESSIEIKRIYLSGRDENSKLLSFFIQVNGIIGVYNKNDFMTENLCAIIREFI